MKEEKEEKESVPNDLTQKLRELWLEDDMKEFMRLYNMGHWMLPELDVVRIKHALKSKGIIVKQETNEKDIFNEISSFVN